MIRLIGVRFRSAGKVYYFDVKDMDLHIGDHVIVETARGPEYGIVANREREVADDMVAQPLRSVLRMASPKDEQLHSELAVKEKEALKICREKIHKHGLEMKLVDAEYAFDGSRILFYFTAEGRVDFRELVKDLASVFHIRIELRQIGVRDETRMLGGIGICGRELCCATYLSDFAPVSIKMAKEQNLSLNPAKISGVCGRLMCCLKNEEDTYEFLNAKMPKPGDEAAAPDGRTGKVIETNVLLQKVKVLFEEGDNKEAEVFDAADLTITPRRRKGEKPEEKGEGKGGRPARGDRPERGQKTERPERRDRKGRGVKAEGQTDEKQPGHEESMSLQGAEESVPSEAKVSGQAAAQEAGQRAPAGAAVSQDAGASSSETGKGSAQGGRGNRNADRAGSEKRESGRSQGRGGRNQDAGRGRRPERNADPQREGSGRAAQAGTERTPRGQREGGRQGGRRTDRQGRPQTQGPDQGRGEERERRKGERSGQSQRGAARQRRQTRPENRPEEGTDRGKVLQEGVKGGEMAEQKPAASHEMQIYTHGTPEG